MPYRHQVRVRYVDCDGQHVVHNAHYLAFVDDAFDCWLRRLHPDFETAAGWDVMVKKAEIIWHGPARRGEILEMAAEPVRWGTSSFDVEFVGSVGDRPVFVATVTYVAVDAADHRPIPVPAELRGHLSDSQ